MIIKCLRIELVEEMILSHKYLQGTHFTLTEIARELNIDRQSVSCIIDQDFDLHPLRKRRVQNLTDLNIEKRMILLRTLLSNYALEKLKTAFFSDKKIDI